MDAGAPAPTTAARESSGLVASRRNQPDSAVLGYATVRTRFGPMRVAGTDAGLRSVALGRSEERHVLELERDFPDATLQEARDALAPWIDALLRHLQGERIRLDLPTDVGGTDFQRRVWRALARIPYGATRSYRQVAREIGRPSAVRAVAGACAANPVALVVPCHRVIRSDGGLGGYQGGTDVKQALLDQERRVAGR